MNLKKLMMMFILFVLVVGVAGVVEEKAVIGTIEKIEDTGKTAVNTAVIGSPTVKIYRITIKTKNGETKTLETTAEFGANKYARRTPLSEFKKGDNVVILSDKKDPTPLRISENRFLFIKDNKAMIQDFEKERVVESSYTQDNGVTVHNACGEKSTSTECKDPETSFKIGDVKITPIKDAEGKVSYIYKEKGEPKGTLTKDEALILVGGNNKIDDITFKDGKFVRENKDGSKLTMETIKELALVTKYDKNGNAINGLIMSKDKKVKDGSLDKSLITATNIRADDFKGGWTCNKQNNNACTEISIKDKDGNIVTQYTKDGRASNFAEKGKPKTAQQVEYYAKDTKNKPVGMVLERRECEKEKGCKTVNYNLECKQAQCSVSKLRNTNLPGGALQLNLGDQLKVSGDRKNVDVKNKDMWTTMLRVCNDSDGCNEATIDIETGKIECNNVCPDDLRKKARRRIRRERLGLRIEAAYQLASQYQGMARLFHWENKFKSFSKFWEENTFGQVLGGNWEESLCSKYFSSGQGTGGGYALVRTPDGLTTVGASVQGRTTRLQYVNETGQMTEKNLLVLQFSVNANTYYEEDILFNIELITSKGVKKWLFINPKRPNAMRWRKVKAGSSYSISGADSFVRYVKHSYDRACLVVKNKPRLWTDARFCADLPLKNKETPTMPYEATMQETTEGQEIGKDEAGESMIVNTDL